jgi:hypothetical protein
MTGDMAEYVRNTPFPGVGCPSFKLEGVWRSMPYGEGCHVLDGPIICPSICRWDEGETGRLCPGIVALTFE